MRLSSNFKELLLEMEKQAFTLPAFDEGRGCHINHNSIKYPLWRNMFLFEELDFDKAIAIYSKKDYYDAFYLESLQETKKYLQERDFCWGDDLSNCMKDSSIKFYDVERFVRKLRADMVYRKRDAGREKADQLLDDYWYSQPDYQRVEKVMDEVKDLIYYWKTQRELMEEEKGRRAVYKSLVGVYPISLSARLSPCI